MAHDKDKKNESFESGLEKLEKLVQTLENSELNLDDALKAFEDGVKLSRLLSEKLSEAEARLETLSKGPNGQPIITPLSLDDEDDSFDEDDN